MFMNESFMNAILEQIPFNNQMKHIILVNKEVDGAMLNFLS